MGDIKMTRRVVRWLDFHEDGGWAAVADAVYNLAQKLFPEDPLGGNLEVRFLPALPVSSHVRAELRNEMRTRYAGGLGEPKKSIYPVITHAEWSARSVKDLRTAVQYALKLADSEEITEALDSVDPKIYEVLLLLQEKGLISLKRIPPPQDKE